MKLNNSPSGTPPSRKRFAIPSSEFGFMTSVARIPATLAGDSRKSRLAARGGESFEERVISLRASSRLGKLQLSEKDIWHVVFDSIGKSAG
jgi:hypothetical protein